MPEKKLTLVLRIVQSVRIGGLWLGSERDKVHYLAKFATLSFMSIYVLQLIALVLAKDDLDRMFECFSVICFCGMGIFKLFSLHRNRNHWLRLLNMMNLLENHQRQWKATANRTDDDKSHVLSCVETYTEKHKRITCILFRIYRFTVVIYILSPFIEYGLLWFLGTRPEGLPHILPDWNPLDKYVGFYVVMVVIEAVAAAYCVLIHEAFDSAAIGVMIFICGQFSSLKLQCSKIGGSGIKYTPTEERDAKAHLRIIECNHTYILLVKSIEELDKLLKSVVGVYFFSATLTLCSAAMRLTSQQTSVMKIISLLQYMSATLTQLFLFCNYGDAVLNESSVGPGEGPFSAAIWCLGPKIRREIAILGFRMMLPRKLHAGPFHTLNLPTFIQIVRTAYSTYAVLGKSKTT